MVVVNDSREKTLLGSGMLEAHDHDQLTKGALVAVAGDTLYCDFKITNTSSTVPIPGAKLQAGESNHVST
jgi:hypothetical protein